MRDLKNLTVRGANDLFGLFNGLNNVVFWMRSDSYQQQLFISKGYEFLWGKPCQILYDYPESWSESVVAATKQELTQFLQQSSKRINDTLIYRIRRSNGELCWIKDQCCPLTNENHQNVGIIGVAELITDDQKEMFTQKPDLLTAHGVYLKDFSKLFLHAYNLKAVTSTINENQFSKEIGQHIVCNGRMIRISRREKEVLNCLFKGQSAKQTARILGISTRTVETYLDNLRAKAGCRTKLALLGQLANRD